MTRKLKIEDLVVESFVVAPETAGERGTVRAFARPKPPAGTGFTCLLDDCQPTFGQSCLPCPTQAATCFDLTCFDCTV